MSYKWQSNMVLMGTGGKNSHVEAVIVDSGETQNLIELPRMHSAYAIDIDFDNNAVAVGTKGGLIYAITEDGTQKPMIHGAPILSVCWVNKSLLAVSDVVGRCILWSIGRKTAPQPIETLGGVICSLLHLADGTLVGFSSTGDLLFWRPPGRQLIRAINVSSPPPIKALVRIVYWPFAHAIACPNREGRLTIYDLEKDKVSNVPAHEGAFYAISVWGEKLLTIGMTDRCLKTWTVGFDRPEREIQVPEGVISVGVGGSQQSKLILVKAQGTAGIYKLEENNLKVSDQLEGKDYRVVATPAPEKIQTFYAQKKSEEVHKILAEIRENNGRVPDDIIERHHARLIEMGYENASLMLRAEQAETEGNIIESLRFRSSLANILPKNDPKACVSMERYAALLEKVWHMQEAAAACKHISNMDPNYPFAVQTENLSRIAKLIEDSSWVIEPDVSTASIDSIIESATIIKKRFLGRYVIKRLNPEPCGKVRLRPEIIAEKYQQILNDSGEQILPAATTERAWWLTRTRNYEVDLVTLGNGQSNNITGLQFAFQVLPGDPGTVVVPVVLFDWRDNVKGPSIEEDNQRAYDVLANIRNKTITNPYLAEVHKVLKHTLRRLVTENL